MSEIISSKRVAGVELWKLPEISQRESAAASMRKASQRSTQALEQLQQQAWQEGFDKGLEEGRAAGAAEASEQSAALRDLIEAIRMPLRDADEHFMQEIGRLALVIARAVVRAELHAHPEAVLDLVRACLCELPVESRGIRVGLHPEDVRLVHENLPEIAGDENIRIIENTHLERGECEVETRGSHVDARIDARVQILAEQMLGPEMYQAVDRHSGGGA